MLETICQKILEHAKHAGAEEADVLGIKGTSTSIEVRNQTLEQIERSEGAEFGLRVFIGKRQAIVSGSDLSDTSIKFMAERAVDMAKAAPIDPYCGLANKSQLARCWDINKFELSDDRDEPQPDEMENIAKETEYLLYRTNRWIRFRLPVQDIAKQRYIYVRLTDLMEVIQKQVFLIHVSQLQDHKQVWNVIMMVTLVSLKVI